MPYSIAIFMDHLMTIQLIFCIFSIHVPAAMFINYNNIYLFIPFISIDKRKEKTRKKI